MKSHGKKYLKAVDNIRKQEAYSVDQAVKKVKELTYVKFDESVDAHINLGIDASKGDQNVRGSIILPHGTGKSVKVIAFAKGEYADAAKKAGADYIGTDDLVEKIESGWTDFDYAIATPDLMGIVGKVAKILGPRGLLPNKKNGTVTFDVGTVINDLKKGRLFFKNDKSGLVHFTFGKVSFDAQKLQDNLVAFIRTLASSKPASSKGKFLKKLTISSTMGVGVRVNLDEIQ
ncbi:50S ribosomal protein L1 [Candidatus Dependentiae bacterium]|nr:50S ribosomal protein L1 [Candidatus Dependentiae bacterium]